MMLSPYSAKAIALQILFRRIRRVDRVLATSRLRRRYFFNDPPLIPRGPSNSVAPPSSLSSLASASFSSGWQTSLRPVAHSLSLFLFFLFRAFVRSEEEEACPSRVLPGKDFVRSLKRLIDENWILWRFYHRFALARSKQRARKLRLLCGFEVGGVWRGLGYLGLLKFIRNF